MIVVDSASKVSAKLIDLDGRASSSSYLRGSEQHVKALSSEPLTLREVGM